VNCSNTYMHIGQWETYLSEAVFSLVLACRCGCNRTWLCVNANVCITDAGCLSCSSDLRSASTCDDVASSSNATFINCQHHTNTLITVKRKQLKRKFIECIVIKPLMLWSLWHRAWLTYPLNHMFMESLICVWSSHIDWMSWGFYIPLHIK